jgi:hypothetical protein
VQVQHSVEKLAVTRVRSTGAERDWFSVAVNMWSPVPDVGGASNKEEGI